MSGKKITFGSRPTKPEVAKDPETWVEQRHEPEPPPEPEGMHRLTLDVRAGLAARIKMIAALRGKPMVKDLRELLEREYSAEVLEDLTRSQGRK